MNEDSLYMQIKKIIRNNDNYVDDRCIDIKNTIKQDLEDENKYIKKLQSKLNAIEEVCNKDNVKSPDKLWEIENILRSVEDEV